MDTHSDLLIVGAGILGLAHALAAVRRGLKVTVIDRDAQANGASIRNFGFVTVTGQQDGDCWRRAMRSREVWAEIAPQAGIRIEQTGLGVAVRHPESLPVLEAFLKTTMGERCEWLTAHQARERMPVLREDAVRAVLWSPHELRVESRDAISKLAAWLESAHGVRILRQVKVLGIDLPHVETSAGRFTAQAAVVCPGDDFMSLYRDRIAAYGLTRCALQMLRVRPATPSRLGAALMSDPSLVRYLGWSELPESKALRERIERESPELLAHGIHLIAVQSADGSLVVGDSHVYADTPPPFASEAVDDLILRELDAVADLPGRVVTERWMGTYASANDRLMLIDRPAERVRLVIVSSGTGASTSFAIAEEVLGELN